MSKKILALVMSAAMAISVFAGCSGNSNSQQSESSASQEDSSVVETNDTSGDTANGDGETFQSRTIRFLSIWDETDPTTQAYTLNELSKEYGETVEGFDFEVEFVSSDQLTQKVTILLSSNDLPDICTYESGTRLKSVIETGQILDMDATLTDLGIRDSLDDGAADLLTTLVDGEGLYDLPLGMNVEGFWYNKALFEEAGIESAPETWDEFLAACESLKTAGINPIVQGGSDKWPMTRVLNAYLVRSVGTDAVKNAMDGTTNFTDDEYVAAAQMFADMASEEYFTVGMTTIDSTTAASMLMNGEAAMMYNGSWMTNNLASEDNAAGEEGIGFFNIPLVNDSSTLTDYSMNCGNIIMFSADKYDEAMADWMTYVIPRIGDYAMENSGTFMGYKINNMPEDVSYYTQIVADALSSATGSFLWFEAKMDSETSTLAQGNIAMLYSGEMTAEEYMSQLQTSAEKNR